MWSVSLIDCSSVAKKSHFIKNLNYQIIIGKEKCNAHTSLSLIYALFWIFNWMQYFECRPQIWSYIEVILFWYNIFFTLNILYENKDIWISLIKFWYTSFKSVISLLNSNEDYWNQFDFEKTDGCHVIIKCWQLTLLVRSLLFDLIQLPNSRWNTELTKRVFADIKLIP